MKTTPIRKSAKGEDCTLRVPGVCNFNPDTTVLCHAPYPGRGGTRSADHFAAYGCSDCHDYMDMRSRRLEVAGIAGSRESLWLSAIHETQKKLIEKGLIKVGKS
jgi:Putative nuclease YbcO